MDTPIHIGGIRFTRGELIRWATVVVVVVIVVVLLAFSSARLGRRQDYQSAQSALRNCLVIEQLKRQIYETALSSERRLPTLAYYQEHPRELPGALKEAKQTVERFSPSDCYQLPEVVDVGITRPR
jgi:type II secretory pathway pseudopilin PulG